MSICDLLFSADMLVPRPREVVTQLIRTIGLPEPGPAAYVEYADEGWDCVFALVNKSFRFAPTRLEVIGPKAFEGRAHPGHGQRISDGQGDRPCKTHATVVATSDMERLARNVRERGLRHWLQEPTSDVPFTRLWMGVTVDAFSDYRPEADAGLRIEVIPSDGPAFPGEVLTRPVLEPGSPAPGQMMRIISRAFLVEDLDATLRDLERNLLWEPEGVISEDRGTGVRHVRMSRNLERGAGLDLVEPGNSQRVSSAEFLALWGAGPYAIRIAVAGLDAKAADLAERGTPAQRHEAGPTDLERLVVDLGSTAGMPIEFVDWEKA